MIDSHLTRTINYSISFSIWSRSRQQQNQPTRSHFWNIQRWSITKLNHYIPDLGGWRNRSLTEIITNTFTFHDFETALAIFNDKFEKFTSRNRSNIKQRNALLPARDTAISHSLKFFMYLLPENARAARRSI